MRYLVEVGLERLAGLIVSMLALQMMQACVEKPNAEERSQVNDLAFDKNGNNIAVLFAAPADLDGPPKDIKNMKEILEGSAYNFNFKTVMQNKAGKADILKITRENAPKADTFFWFFSGHGASDGSLASEDDMFEFSEVMKVMEEVRSSPFKRLFIFVDACFAGNLVNGSQPVINDSGAETGSTTPGGLAGTGGGDDADGEVVPGGSGSVDDDSTSGDDEWIKSKSAKQKAAKAYAGLVADKISKALVEGQAGWKGKVYEEALVFSSSTKDETSGDTSSGGVFANALKDAFAKLKKEKSDKATIRDLVDTTGKFVNGQTPVFRALPADKILSDLLFEAGSGSGPDTRLFAALEPSSDPGKTFIWAATGKNSNFAKVYICSGNSEKCTKNPLESLSFQLQTTAVADRAFYKSTAKMDIKDGDVVTLLGVNSSNAVVSSATIMFKPE